VSHCMFLTSATQKIRETAVDSPGRFRGTLPNRDKSGRYRPSVFPTLALSLLAVLVTLAMMEAAVRVCAAVMGDQPAMILDGTLGWKLRPNINRVYTREERPYWIQTNSRGHRDKEYSDEKPAHRTRLIVLGDSFVFGSGGVDSAETFTKRLEDSDHRLQAINLGVPGYSTDQELLLLQSEGLRYHPDIVILCVYWNDFRGTFESWDEGVRLPKGYFTSSGTALQYQPPRISWLSFGSRWSYAAHLLVQRYRRSARGWDWQPAPNLKLEEREQVFTSLLTEMNRACQRVGARFVVVYIPRKTQPYHSPFQDVIALASTSHGFTTLDLTETLREADRNQPVYFNKDIHLNPRGHRIVADALRELISTDVATAAR